MNRTPSKTWSIRHTPSPAALRRASIALGALAAILIGCSRDSEAADGKPAAQGSTTTAIAATSRIVGNHFTLTAKPDTSCKAGSECTVELVLEASGDYHINKEYPYKFKANPANVEFLGKSPGGPNVFTKEAGDFKIRSEKVGVMAVRFKPKGKGAVEIGGRYKLSVCSTQNCQLETQTVGTSVQVN